MRDRPAHGTLVAMSASDTYGTAVPPPPASGHRVLRRSRDNRVAAGVSSGLGEYFGVDPVLFRVLFATSAFFAGAGILAYLLAWAAIPEQGTERAPIDGWVGALRRRHVPIWLVAIVAGLFLWLVSFSWWAPGPVFPVVVVIVLLIVLYGRREMQARGSVATPPAPQTAGPVSLVKSASPEASTQPTWVGDARAWFVEAREASRLRRRRTLPIRLGILGTLVAALLVLGIIDAVSSIQLQVYFWTVLGVVVLGLLVGLVSRRMPYSMIPLLIPAIAGTVAFAGSHTTLHDGIGQREWRPTAVPAAQYRIAFGQGTLDLRKLPAQQVPRTIRITAGAGQIKIIAPKTLNLRVLANIHIGVFEVNGSVHREHSGVGLSRTVGPPADASGTPITVDVHLADGNITVLQT